MNHDHDLINLADEWPFPNLSSRDRNKIKAELLKAQAIYYRLPINSIGFISPMRSVYAGVAKILFEAKLLTVELLENELRLFAVEAALVGGWLWEPTNEAKVEIFPSYFGHQKEWENFNKRFAQCLFALTSEWHGKLLDAGADDKNPTGQLPSVSIAVQLIRLKEEAHLTTEELAGLIQIDVRSVQRHLAGHSIPYDRHLRAYEREFSKLLGRKIVISRTS